MIRSTPTIGFISDTHHADPRHDVTVEDADRLVDGLLGDDKLDLIVIGGDDVGSGLRSEFDEAAGPVERLAEKADVDVVRVPGNHGVSIQGSSWRRWTRGNWEQYAERTDSLYTAGDDWPRVLDYGDVRVILGDTCAEPTMLARGCLGSEQIQAVAAAIADWHGPTALFTHHCPSSDGRGLDRALVLADRDEATQAFQAAGGLDLWGTGHLHQKLEASYVFGATRLLGSPMSVAEGGCWRISWDDRGFFGWEWVPV